MAVYKKKPNNKNTGYIVNNFKNNKEVEGITPNKLRVAQNSLTKELLELSNNLDIPKETIKTRDFGDISLQLIANLASLGNTEEIIAKTLGMTSRTLRNLKKTYPEVEEAIGKGQALISSKLMNIALSKIEEEKDTGNKILLTLMSEFSNIGNKSSIKIEHSVSEDTMNQEKTIERQKNIMSKVFELKKVEEFIEADFEEVKEEKVINEEYKNG